MTRKFTLFVCLFLYAKLSLSQTSADSLRLDINRIVQPLDKSQVPFGMLEEYGLGLLPLDVFKGTLTDSTVADIKIWRGLYASLYTSRIYGANPMATLQTVNTTLQNELQLADSLIPVAIMDYNYAAFRSDAISAGLISSQNGQLFDVPNRPASPYLQRNCFAAAPLKYWSSGQPSLIFKQNLYYSNRGKTISSIKVNFGDGGGLHTATFGVALTANYANNGSYNIAVQVTYTDNSIMQCYAKLEVTNVGIGTARYNEFFPDDQQFFFGTANHSGATVSIAYSQSNTTWQIRKPLIVVEGYDVSAIAPNVQSNYGYRDFMAGLDAPGATYDFNDELDMADYDIIFIDFWDGADDIRRNAALVQEVISWVNQQKTLVGSTEQNVVLGLSMGGLVARYALASMTKQSVNTGTRLLITHDSPHRGANLPIGVQHLITILNLANFLPEGMKITDFVPELKEARAVSEAPATQQLLLLRSVASSGNYEAVPNTFLDNEYRTMITFAAGGPQPTYRMVATSLGSQCGNPILAPATKLLDIRGKFRLSVLIFRANYYLDMESWALNNTNALSTVTDIRFHTNKTLLFIPISRTLYRKTIKFNPVAVNIPAWDIVPGGSQSTLSQVGGVPSQIPDYVFDVNDFIRAKVSTEINVATGSSFCFVPVVSALDVSTINTSSLNARYINGYTQYTSRMNTFIAQEQFTGAGTQHFNQEHLLFTARNARWMFNEMEGLSNAENCATECTMEVASNITGPEEFCTTGSYQVGGSIPTGATITWTASPAGVVTFSPSGNSVNITKVPSAFGQTVTINAFLNNVCGNHRIATKSIGVGAPSVYNGTTLNGGTVSGAFVNMDNAFGTFALSSASGYTSATWTLISGSYNGFSFYPANNGRSVNVNFGFNIPNGATGYLNVVANHACGQAYGQFNFIYGGSGGFSVVPNPAFNSVRVEMSGVMESSDPSNKLARSKEIGTIQRIQVVDKMGNVILERTYSGDTKVTTLDVAALRNDIYIIRVFNGLQWSSKQVIVQH